MRVSPTIRNLSVASGVLSLAAAGILLAQQQYPYPPQQQESYPPQQQPQQPGDPSQYPDQGQQQQPAFDDSEPGRGVARISLINGEVNFKRGDTEDVVAAAINAPMMAGDRLMTGQGRAEIQFDSANVLRLNGGTEVRMSELEWQRYMIQIAGGTITFRVLRNSDAQVEINTPTVALRPSKKGEYRISVLEDGTTEITVRSGELEIYTPRGSEKLKSGKTMLARGTADNPEFQVNNAPQRDEFDAWNQDRDRYLERSQSYGQVSQDIYGTEDLDANGQWQNSSQYGQVWVPRVGQDWAPYQDGRWVYYDYYGWTWVSNDTWGWAPYHYGRWYNDPSYGWAWWPGQRSGRHFWRPAYVSFFGWGDRGGFNANVGFGFGNVGWVPLAPYEPCYGWWGRNRYNSFGNGRFFNNTRIVNNVNVTNIYRNARVRNGITSMSSNNFGRGRVFSGNMIRGSGNDYRGAGVVRGNLPVVPDRMASTRLNDRGVVGSFRGRGDNMRFAQTRQPSAVNRVSFDDQRRGTQELARRSFGGANGGPVASPRGGGEFSSRPGAQPENGGWRRSTELRGGGNINGQMQRSPESVERGNGTNSGGGWRRFGDSRRGGEQPSGTPRTMESRENGDSWNRFGNSGRVGGAGINPVDAGVRQQQQQMERQQRQQRTDSDNAWRQQRSMERQQQQQVRISPPIVRERTSENRGGRGGFGGFGNSGGGSRRSESPRMERSSPSSGGGSPRSMGGGSRGGGGGGGRSGGGGGNRGGGRNR